MFYSKCSALYLHVLFRTKPNSVIGDYFLKIQLLPLLVNNGRLALTAHREAKTMSAG